MSFTERPLLYDISGGSFKISLSFGCFSIKCHLFIRISFKFGIYDIYDIKHKEVNYYTNYIEFFSVENKL